MLSWSDHDDALAETEGIAELHHPTTASQGAWGDIPQEEVRVAAPAPVEERRLVYDVGAG
jgi:hypothetical protein